MRIVLGCDHGGYQLKKRIIRFLEAKGYSIADLGTHSPQPCDYPLVSWRVAQAVSEGEFERGILICKTGIGISIVANKVPKVRAALCQNKRDAKLSREHNDANILVLGANNTKERRAKEILEVWLKTPFQGGRHARRLSQIRKIEKEIIKTYKASQL
jgi:RpiB/LacA/LacB family sugar-phosphate isomerase